MFFYDWFIFGVKTVVNTELRTGECKIDKLEPLAFF